MNEKCIRKIAETVRSVKDKVSSYCSKNSQILLMLDQCQEFEYLPTPLEIAEYYGIEVVFTDLNGDMPSYMHRQSKTIYIADKYRQDTYAVKFFCAHELGHFFLHDCDRAAMNNDILNEALPQEMILEYEANVFAILLMPQAMGGKEWERDSPRILNRKIYQKFI